jgi:ABC-2 type transport system ATP-binding protein
VDAVHVDGLQKRYKDVHAVRGVSFTVPPGEVFALLGPNGAGKTTTVEILEGFRRADAGDVRVLGLDPAERSTSRVLRERLGIVLQELAVEPSLTVREAVAHNAGFYPAPRDVDEVVALVGLSEKAGTRIKTLSGGQQRRLDLALGIIGNPELLFLDEPTTGFDPSARRGAWELVRSLTGEGATVILTTHYMEEAEALANRVAVIAKGLIVAEGSPSSIGGRDAGHVTISFRLPDGVAVSELPVTPSAVTADVVAVETEDEVEVLYRLTGWARSGGYALPGLGVERRSLEDVYLQLTGDPVHGDHPPPGDDARAPNPDGPARARDRRPR